MQDEPLVSVILPCYNASNWIKTTIKSILDQTYNNIEIIAVDDASSDRTVDILQNMNVDQLLVLENESNQGIPETKNRGIKEANGEIIAFLDQDDYWLSKKIELQVNKMLQNDSIGIVYTDMYEISGCGQPLRLKYSQNPPTNELFDHFYMGNVPCYNVTKVVKRRCFEELGMLDTQFYGTDDQDFDLRVANHPDWTFEYISEPLVLKRVHGKNASGEHIRLNTDLIRLAQKHRGNLHNPKLAKRRLSNLYVRRAFRRLQNGEETKAKEDLKAAIRHNIFEMKAYILAPALLMGSQLCSGYLDRLEDLQEVIANDPYSKEIV